MLVGFLECCECYLPRQLSCFSHISHICPHHVAAGVRWEKQDQGRVSLGLRLAVLPPHVDQRQRPQSGIWGPRGLLLGCLVAGSKSLVEACQMGRKGCRSLPALGEEALPGHSEPHAECQSASRDIVGKIRVSAVGGRANGVSAGCCCCACVCRLEEGTRARARARGGRGQG